MSEYAANCQVSGEPTVHSGRRDPLGERGGSSIRPTVDSAATTERVTCPNCGHDQTLAAEWRTEFPATICSRCCERLAKPETSRYPTEWVDCDKCDGTGEYDDDLWMTTRCYSCGGRGTIEVCAACGDTGEECDACGC